MVFLYYAVKRFCEPQGQRRSWTVWSVCITSLPYQWSPKWFSFV